MPAGGPYALQVVEERYEISSDGYPPLRMGLDGGQHTFTIDRKRLRDVRYLLERTRGYDSVGELYSPGFFRVSLGEGSPATFFASVEPWAALEPEARAAARAAEEERRRQLLAAAHPQAREGLAAHLVIAADQFLVAPAARAEDAATRDDACTVIAGYHWFTDWGRDTMISLEGLTLVTGRAAEARAILRTFADAVRDGLIPNLYPEHGHEGLYHTADATLWFFHAIDRYVRATGDRETLQAASSEAGRHRRPAPRRDTLLHRRGRRRSAVARGTRLRADVDGRQGRRPGRHASTRQGGRDQRALVQRALPARRLARGRARCRRPRRPIAPTRSEPTPRSTSASGTKPGGYLYDVVDGVHGRRRVVAAQPDPRRSRSSTRSSTRRAGAASCEQVQSRLLSPFGLRSLAPGDPDYHPKYFGDLRARDLAYHQGTVWAWLVGPWIDASIKVHGHANEARALLEGFAGHLTEAGVGTISEIFDAEAPFSPRGCIAQAWSVAEVLRCLVRTSQRAVASAENPRRPLTDTGRLPASVRRTVVTEMIGPGRASCEIRESRLRYGSEHERLGCCRVRLRSK